MDRKAVLNYLFALFLYGTIGLFLHFIRYSSEFVVLCRGTLGSLFIYVIMRLNDQQLDHEKIRKNIKLLFLSGACLGLSWVFLFTGYRYGIGVTSLCNYMAPIIVVVISILFYREKTSFGQIVCIAVAFIGMLLVGGVGRTSQVDPRCVIYGSLAALGFAVMVLCNRSISDMPQLDKTLVQLIFAMTVVLPYVIFTNGFPTSFDLRSSLLTLILGVLHTGIAYICYFSAIYALPARSIAILGYLEPAINVILGAIFLNEPLEPAMIMGTLLIIAASVVNEFLSDK